MANWVIEQGVNGPRLVMNGPWSDDAMEAAQSFGIRELELNYAKGWKGVDLGFLRELRDIEALEITDWVTKDVGVVNELGSLRRLKVFTYCSTELQFSQFPHLEACSLEWRPRAASLFNHRGVKKLFINKYPGNELVQFSGMRSLLSLSLASPKIETLGGIQALEHLTFLGLYVARRLTTLDGIEALKNLVQLDVNDCKKIQDVAPLSSLRKLRELHLCNDGDIESIKPLIDLRRLEKFVFYESTNVRDGDLTPLTTLPMLRAVAFMERPHYSHRREELNLVT